MFIKFQVFWCRNEDKIECSLDNCVTVSKTDLRLKGVRESAAFLHNLYFILFRSKIVQNERRYVLNTMFG